jgi:hypothetical protein
MLGIKDKNGRWKEWHVNEPLPKIEGQVVTFQADGHELELFLRAMEQGFNYEPFIPRCPKCGSYKLSCRDGHVWEVPSEK